MKHLLPLAARLKPAMQKGNSALLLGPSKVTTVYRPATSSPGRRLFIDMKKLLRKPQKSQTCTPVTHCRGVCVCGGGDWGRLLLTAATAQRNHMRLRWLTPGLEDSVTHKLHWGTSQCFSHVIRRVKKYTKKYQNKFKPKLLIIVFKPTYLSNPT